MRLPQNRAEISAFFLRGANSSSQECVAPLFQTLRAGTRLSGVGTAGILEPLDEQLAILSEH